MLSKVAGVIILHIHCTLCEEKKEKKKETSWFCAVLTCYVRSPPSSHLHLSMRVGRGAVQCLFL